jgi:hypothetical protein
MSIGELARLYQDKVIYIHPEFQRFSDGHLCKIKAN